MSKSPPPPDGKSRRERVRQGSPTPAQEGDTQGKLQSPKAIVNLCRPGSPVGGILERPSTERQGPELAPQVHRHAQAQMGYGPQFMVLLENSGIHLPAWREGCYAQGAKGHGRRCWGISANKTEMRGIQIHKITEGALPSSFISQDALQAFPAQGPHSKKS